MLQLKKNKKNLSQMLQQKACHKCCSKRLVTNVAAKGLSQMLQQIFVTNAAVMFHTKSKFLELPPLERAHF